MSDIVVTLRHDCCLNTKYISPIALKRIKKEFTHKNQNYFKMEAMGYPPNEPRSYQTFNIDKNGILSVWRGGAITLNKILQEHGYSVQWDDQRYLLGRVAFTKGMLRLRDYQYDAVKLMLKQNQGILRGKTGSGKTETLLGAIVAAKQPALVIVWNKDLQKQWVDRILKYGILEKSEIGGIGGSFRTKSIGPITIAMQQSLVRSIPMYLDKFGTIIMDECQRAPANTFIKTVTCFPAKYRWGASADERRTDKKEFLAYDSFGPVIHEMDSGESVLNPSILIIPTVYTDQKYEDDRNFSRLMNRMVESAPRNELIATYLKRELLAGRQIILFTERVAAAEYWVHKVRNWGIDAGPLIGGHGYRDETSATIDLMRKGVVRFGASTTYADAALDIPTLDCAFITCPTAGNEKRLGQQIGRVLRPSDGKPKPKVYYFWDKGVLGISSKINQIKRKWKDCWEILDG